MTLLFLISDAFPDELDLQLLIIFLDLLVNFIIFFFPVDTKTLRKAILILRCQISPNLSFLCVDYKHIKKHIKTILDILGLCYEHVIIQTELWANKYFF